MHPLPFTLGMVGLVVACGLSRGSHRGPTDTQVFQTHGFSALHLLEGRWTRILTSVFFTAGGVAFYVSVMMLALCVGIAESQWGTWRTAAIYWGTHAATLVVASLAIAIPLERLDAYRGMLLINARDVGPSAGYYGCLGATLGLELAGWPLAISVAILACLMIRFGISLIRAAEQGRHIASDLAHLIAFPLGLGLAQVLSR